MSKFRIRASLTVGLLWSLATGCLESPESRVAATDGLPGTIRAAIGAPSTTVPGEFDLYVSARSGAAPLILCAGTVLAADCKVGAPGYRTTVKTATVAGVDIFRVDTSVRGVVGVEMVVVAHDALNVVTESQKIRFVTKGTAVPGLSTATTSGGSGGVKGRQETSFVVGTQTLKYIINAPQDNSATKAHGLLILLHGSSASSYDRFVEDMATASQTNGLIPVSVLAPNGSGWNEGGDAAQKQYAEALDSLIQNKLRKEYNIDMTKIFFSGQSSGGGWLASYFIPLKGANYLGGAFLQCGMMPPQAPFTASDAMKKGFKLHFEITTGDGIWSDYFDSTIAQYKTAGLTVTSDNTKPGGHCNFDQAEIIAQRIGAMLRP